MMQKIREDMNQARSVQRAFAARRDALRASVQRAMNADQWDRADRLAMLEQQCNRAVIYHTSKIEELREGMKIAVRG